LSLSLHRLALSRVTVTMSERAGDIIREERLWY
jgi:hypothetical protein